MRDGAGHFGLRLFSRHGIHRLRRVRLFAFVHPVIRRLPQEQHIRVEQWLLKTFGPVMPVLMTFSLILSFSYAIKMNSVEGTARIIAWASTVTFAAALISTIIFNVPINLATERWDADDPPEKWKETRNRWEFFQGLRSRLLLPGFILLCFAMTLLA